jgi:D-alanyl-D-alanine carboxypeptidase/D-alanyl-D-alanine-endopeptidase (penicillin-binding protein 4)
MPVALVLAVLLVSSAGAAEPPFQSLARDLVGPDQGVYAVAEDGTVLAAVVAERPVHPASVTKVATTLALLRQLGPEHRFPTRVLAAGPIQKGALHGDLVVEAGGDPALLDENVVLVLAALRGRGLARVEGEVRVEGPLVFDWRTDGAARALRRALAGQDATARAAVARVPLPGASPATLFLRVDGRRVPPAADGRRLLLVHRSPPLVRVAKSLNCYSNNVFHVLSDRIGGPAAVGRVARESVPAAMRDEIVVENAAGKGMTNRLSPRVAVALLAALERETAAHGLTLRAVLPVSGIDPGTLHKRLGPGVVVGKTGTIGSLRASGLAGALSTQRHGRVLFAVLNHGLSVPEAQRRQDAFVRALLEGAGGGVWTYPTPDGPLYAAAEIEIVP